MLEPRFQLSVVRSPYVAQIPPCQSHQDHRCRPAGGSVGHHRLHGAQRQGAHLPGHRRAGAAGDKRARLRAQQRRRQPAQPAIQSGGADPARHHRPLLYRGDRRGERGAGAAGLSAVSDPVRPQPGAAAAEHPLPVTAGGGGHHLQSGARRGGQNPGDLVRFRAAGGVRCPLLLSG